MSDFAASLGPFATLSVGLAASFIAWQQWQLAQNKFRLDLFDRRYRVFDAARKFLAQSANEGRVDDSKLAEFYAGISDAGFLFKPEVGKYLEVVVQRALKMDTHRKLCEPLPVGEARSRLAQAELDERTWLIEQLTAISKVFSPYLGFSHIN